MVISEKVTVTLPASYMRKVRILMVESEVEWRSPADYVGALFGVELNRAWETFIDTEAKTLARKKRADESQADMSVPR